MAISSAGIGSGLDVSKIVEQMVAYEKSPLKKLEVRAEGIQTKISTYGEIKSLTSKLGDIVSKLTRDSAWNSVEIKSSNSTISGTMTGIAAQGVFNIQVDKLAQAQTTVLGGASGVALAKDTKMDSGSSLKFTVGSEEHEIATGGKTLTEIAASVNEKGMGIQATVVTNVDGSERLMLRSKETGSTSGFEVAVQGASQLEVPASHAQKAQDAVVRLNGVEIQSTTNTFANSIPGMSFTVSEVTTTPASLTVKADTESMKKNIQEFVDAYNELNELLSLSTKGVRTADGKVDESALAKGAGGLQGDSATISLQNTLRMLTQGMSGSGGAFSRLSDIGIQMKEGGTLEVDTSKLDKGLADLESLKGLFAHKADSLGQNGGIAVNFKNFTDKLLAFDGTLNTKTDSLERTLKSNGAEQDKVNKRADALESRLYQQYTALDVKMASLNALNAYVSQMVTTWNKTKD